jgi:hypothetical protein
MRGSSACVLLNCPESSGSESFVDSIASRSRAVVRVCRRRGAPLGIHRICCVLAKRLGPVGSNRAPTARNRTGLEGLRFPAACGSVQTNTAAHAPIAT